MAEKGSEIWPQEIVQSDEMLNELHMPKLAKVVHEKVEKPPSIQREDDDMQIMEHDRGGGVQADKAGPLGSLEDAERMYNHAQVDSEKVAKGISPGPVEGLIYDAFTQPQLETTFQETPDRSMLTLASKNPFHHFQASKNPFAQPHHGLRVNASDSHQHSHPVRSESYPSENSTLQPLAHSQTTSAALSGSGQKKHKFFPPIQSSTGQFNITHVGNNQHFADSSSHVANVNSGNTTTTIIKNSNNDSSIKVSIDGPQQYMQKIKSSKIVPPHYATGNLFG